MSVARLLLAAAVVAASLTPSTAAPVPKDRSLADELRGVCDAAGRAASGGGAWSADNDRQTAGLVTRLLGTVSKAGRLEPRASPLGVGVDVVAPGETGEVLKILTATGKRFVCRSGTFSSIKDTVILAESDADVGSAFNCVILAGRDAKVSHLRNCVVFAGRGVDVSHTSPPRKDPFDRAAEKKEKPGEAGSVLVAGHWLGVSHCNGAACWVVAPETPPDHPEKKAPRAPVEISTAINVLFLNPPADRKKGYEGTCRTVPAPRP